MRSWSRWTTVLKGRMIHCSLPSFVGSDSSVPDGDGGSEAGHSDGGLITDGVEVHDHWLLQVALLHPLLCFSW